jgi:hypothetical protein
MSNIGVDCSKWPSGETCSVQLTGDEEHVVTAAARHRASEHGDVESEARANINAALNDPAKPYAWHI